MTEAPRPTGRFSTGPRQPTEEPSTIPRRWGRFLIWVKTIGRSDDTKINAIYKRALNFQGEEEWALQRLFTIRKKLQNPLKPGEEPSGALQKTLSTIEEISRIWKSSLHSPIPPQRTISQSFQKAYAEDVADKILHNAQMPGVEEKKLIESFEYEAQEVRRLTPDSDIQNRILDEIGTRILLRLPAGFFELREQVLNNMTPSVKNTQEKALSLLRGLLSNKKTSEGMFLLKIGELLKRAKDQKVEGFPSNEFVRQLSALVPQNMTLVHSFLTAIQTKDLRPLFRAIQLYASELCDHLLVVDFLQPDEEAERVQKIHLERARILLAGEAVFSHEDLEQISTNIYAGIRLSLVERIDSMSFASELDSKTFKPQQLEESLSQFISFQARKDYISALANAPEIRKEVQEALQKMLERVKTSGHFKTMIDAIVSYCRRVQRFDFDAMKECWAVLAKCPEEIQVLILAALRDKFTVRGKLPEEIDPLYQNNRLADLSQIAKTVFECPWIQTLTDLKKI